MDRSLSVLLPVRNVESTLATLVLETLEATSELACWVEIVVLDDCSYDATIEVADELVTQYPQLRVARHSKPRGASASVRTAFELSSGQVVFLQTECKFSVQEISKLWQALDACELALGRPSSGPFRTASPADRLAMTRGHFLMAPRAALEPLLDSLDDRDTLLAAVQRRGIAWREIEIADRRPPLFPYRVATLARRLFGTRIDGPERSLPAETDRAVPPARAKKPNYLARIKEFAWGE